MSKRFVTAWLAGGLLNLSADDVGSNRSHVATG